ncbi:MAG TPA: hypothetical protein VFA96_04240 [Nocardioides sp.]|nr:hypothetical protein [Nocardioides sp.]
MSRRPTPAVYRRRRLVVGLGAVAVVVLLVWLCVAAVSALTGSHSNAGAQASASLSASAEADSTPTISVSSVPAGGACDPGDIVVRPVPAMAHVNGPVPLTFQVFTRVNPVCTWQVTHATVAVTISDSGTPSFWSTTNCWGAVKPQNLTLHQGSPITVTLAIWNAQGSSQASGCAGPNPWAVPGLYDVQAAALGGDPSAPTPLRMVAPGVPLVQPTSSSTPSPTAKATTPGTGTPKPKATTSPKSTPTPTQVF